MTQAERDAMVERIASLPATSIVRLAKDEGVNLGYIGGSRRSMARAIVSERERRIRDRELAARNGSISKWHLHTTAFYNNEHRLGGKVVAE